MAGNIGRSIILSNVRERQGESLKLLVLDCVNNIGLNLKHEEIEIVFQIGDPNKKRAWPRPIKCVLYDELRRDQILYFKSGLRYSLGFKYVKINKEEHKEKRIKRAILRHAALIARNEGIRVFQKEDRVIIDGTAYTLENIEDIPQKFRRCQQFDHELTLPEKATTHATNVVYISP